MSPALESAREAAQRWTTYAGLTLLVADGEPALWQATARRLSTAGVRVTPCTDAAEALLSIGREDPDVVLLAADLPVAPAAAVVTAVRRTSSVPILIGSGPEDTAAAGYALLAGATRLVARPYEAEELLRVIENSRTMIEARRQVPATLTYGPLELCSASFSVRLDGRELALPLKEFELLRLLMLNADRVVTVDQIRDALWGPGGNRPSSNAATVHLARLRGRVGGPEVLRTVRGVGYRLTFPEPPPPRR